MSFFNLKTALPALMPLAIQWAEATAEYAAMCGRPLGDQEKELARRVGVNDTDRVRIFMVDQMPYPEHPALQAAAMATDFLSPQTQGLALGHSIMMRRGKECGRLLAHEFRHVHQYENAGSIAAFLEVFLEQVVDHGHDEAPLEIDARAYEVAG